MLTLEKSLNANTRVMPTPEHLNFFLKPQAIFDEERKVITCCICRHNRAVGLRRHNSIPAWIARHRAAANMGQRVTKEEIS